MKNWNKVQRCLKFFILFTVAFVFYYCAAGGPKSEGSDSSSSGSASQPSSEVDSVKQAAEAAEWEAHRLREEIFRKQQSNPSN